MSGPFFWFCWIVGCLGSLFTVLAILWVVVGLLWRKKEKFLEKEEEQNSNASIKDSDMPILRPLPIRTKCQRCIKSILRWLYCPRQWKLEKDWEYRLNDKMTIIIPKEFIFDGASVPRPFWSFLSPVDLILIPALVHDYAYRFGFLETKTAGIYGKNNDRPEWDRLFFDMGKNVNDTLVLNWIAYKAIRYFGKSAWDEHTDHRKQALSSISQNAE